MSHRPKVPSTLKLLEGVEVSFLLSLEFSNFLFLYQESQVSQFPQRALPWPRWLLCVGTTLPELRNPQVYSSRGLWEAPHFTAEGTEAAGDRRLAHSHTTFRAATQRWTWASGSSLALDHFTTLPATSHGPARSGAPGPGPRPSCLTCPARVTVTHRTFPQSTSSSQSSITVAVRATLLSCTASWLTADTSPSHVNTTTTDTSAWAPLRSPSYPHY